jgi:amino acid permease
MTKACWHSLCSSGLKVSFWLLVGVGFFKLLHHDVETKAPSLLKCAALVINVAIAVFLIVKVRASNVEELPRSDKRGQLDYILTLRISAGISDRLPSR